MMAIAMPSGDTDQLIVKLLPTVIAPPPKGGTCGPRNLPTMQPPTGVPLNGPLSMTAAETEPFGANVIFTWPEPVGPPGFAHDWTLTAPMAPEAAPRSNGALDSLAGGGAAGFG